MAPPRLCSPSCAQAGSPSAMPPLPMIYGKGDASIYYLELPSKPVDSELNRSWRLIPPMVLIYFLSLSLFLLLNSTGQRSAVCPGYQEVQTSSAPGSRVPLVFYFVGGPGVR